MEIEEQPAHSVPRPSPAQVSALPFVLFVSFCSRLVLATSAVSLKERGADHTPPRKSRSSSVPSLVQTQLTLLDIVRVQRPVGAGRVGATRHLA